VLTKALNTAGPVLVDIQIDYSDNQDLCAIVSENAGLEVGLTDPGGNQRGSLS